MIVVVDCLSIFGMCFISHYSFVFASYYIEEFIFKDDATDEEEAVTFYISELLASDGIFATQVGDAPTLDTAGIGNPNMQDRFDFIDSLQENGFVRIVDYEEVCVEFWNFCFA